MIEWLCAQPVEHHTPQLIGMQPKFGSDFILTGDEQNLHLQPSHFQIWLVQNRDVHPCLIPIGSMYGVYSYIYHKNSTIHVGKYTSPMDPMGVCNVEYMTRMVHNCRFTSRGPFSMWPWADPMACWAFLWIALTRIAWSFVWLGDDTRWSFIFFQ